MINYEKFTLDNGLRVLFHHDANSPMAVVNTLYDVGARDESPDKTGFAHLFEHLMFGGSVNIPDFDGPLQRAGGQSNAFTSNDITNYYDVLPKQNIETALWLESDRMLSLAFTDKSLEVQRNVVIEEFKQRYLNQPYGDVWLNLRPLAYKTHPYQWATIGKEIAHIEQATMDDVRAFFATHYHPSNAVLTVAGDFELNQVADLVNKWYRDIPQQIKQMRNLPMEPEQKELRKLTIERPVPSNAFYYAFHMSSRLDSDYYTADLVSDILGRGKSSVLHKRLLQDEQLVTEIQCYILGSHDAGLILVSGKLNEGISFEQFDAVLWDELAKISCEPVAEHTLTKVRNKWQTSKEFGDMGLLPRAMNLSLFELLGNSELVNSEVAYYRAITPEKVQAFCAKTFQVTNCSIVYVQSQTTKS